MKVKLKIKYNRDESLPMLSLLAQMAKNGNVTKFKVKDIGDNLIVLSVVFPDAHSCYLFGHEEANANVKADIDEILATDSKKEKVPWKITNA